jgi:hypothetical protein
MYLKRINSTEQLILSSLLQLIKKYINMLKFYKISQFFGDCFNFKDKC